MVSSSLSRIATATERYRFWLRLPTKVPTVSKPETGKQKTRRRAPNQGVPPNGSPCEDALPPGPLFDSARS